MQDDLYMFIEICEKWLLVQKMKEIFKVSYDILLYLEKKTHTFLLANSFCPMA